tara:strand:- start:283 stop:420 length:138 start_codon:yes stop_codon:yes gene_type:complete
MRKIGINVVILTAILITLSSCSSGKYTACPAYASVEELNDEENGI